MDGVKYDTDKPRWDLLPLDIVEEIVKVLTVGAIKYDDDNWKKVYNFKRRYYAAALRHLTAWQSGETIDTETGLPHLAHAATNLIFLLWKDKHEDSIHCRPLDGGDPGGCGCEHTTSH